MDYIPENHSHSICVKLLIQAGADVNGKTIDGRKPLLNAARNDQDECVDLLIQAGAIVNDADRSMQHSDVKSLSLKPRFMGQQNLYKSS